eukprot:1176986-Prorocentrum_minimum.AAC.2
MPQQDPPPHTNLRLLFARATRSNGSLGVFPFGFGNTARAVFADTDIRCQQIIGARIEFLYSSAVKWHLEGLTDGSHLWHCFGVRNWRNVRAEHSCRTRRGCACRRCQSPPPAGQLAWAARAWAAGRGVSSLGRRRTRRGNPPSPSLSPPPEMRSETTTKSSPTAGN